MISKRRKWVVLSAVALVSAGIILVVELISRPEGPIYKGRHLSEWLASYLQATNSAQAEAAKEAVRSTGTNALPLLVSWVGYQPSRTDYIVATLRDSISDKINLPWARGLDWNKRRHQAFLGFWILGADAELALPELRMVLARTGHEAEYPAQYARMCVYVITNQGIVVIWPYLPQGHPDGTNILTPALDTSTNTQIK